MVRNLFLKKFQILEFVLTRIVSIHLFEYISGIVVTPSFKSCGFDTVHEDTSAINSPNYPNNYRANFSCFWRISAPMGKRVKVLINDLKFETQKCKTWHHFRVWDGPSNRGKLIHMLREIDSPVHIVSSNESLYLNHYSWNYPANGCENHMTDRGFHLEYSVYGKNDTY